MLPPNLDVTGPCLASPAHLSVARDPMWQPFRKEKEANDVFDHQECRWVLEASLPCLSNVAHPLPANNMLSWF